MAYSRVGNIIIPTCVTELILEIVGLKMGSPTIGDTYVEN